MSSPTQSATPLASYTPINAGVLARRTTGALIAIATIIGLVGAGAFFMINSQIQDQLKVQDDRQTQVGSAQQVANREATAQSAYAQVQSQLRFVNDPIDVKSYVPTLLPQIETLAKSYDLQVSEITPGILTSPVAPAAAAAPPSAGGAPAPAAPIPAAPTFQTMTLGLNLSGPYKQVMSFIYSLTRFPKVVMVKQIGLHPSGSAAPGSTAKGNDKVDVSLQMIAYIFAPTAASAQTAASTAPGTAASNASTTASAAANSAPGQSTASPIATDHPMHGLMISPISTSPLPTPGILKTLNPAKYGSPAGGSPGQTHK